MLSRYYTCLCLSLTHMSHHSPFPYTRFTSSVVSLLHIHSLPLTHKRVHKHTDTHKHPFTWILISPHVCMCISHTHSLIMYMCLHVTQHKAPCTCLSLSSTHIDTKNLLSLPQSLTYHTRTLSLSLANTLNKGFPVNNLPSIHQQLWQYGKHEM